MGVAAGGSEESVREVDPGEGGGCADRDEDEHRTPAREGEHGDASGDGGVVDGGAVGGHPAPGDPHEEGTGAVQGHTPGGADETRDGED